jgi:hypothetical protein
MKIVKDLEGKGGCGEMNLFRRHGAAGKNPKPRKRDEMMMDEHNMDDVRVDLEKCRALLRMADSPEVHLYVTALQEIAEEMRQEAMEEVATQNAYRLQCLDMSRGIERAMNLIEGNVETAREELAKDAGLDAKDPEGGAL